MSAMSGTHVGVFQIIWNLHPPFFSLTCHLTGSSSQTHPAPSASSSAHFRANSAIDGLALAAAASAPSYSATLCATVNVRSTTWPGNAVGPFVAFVSDGSASWTLRVRCCIQTGRRCISGPVARGKGRKAEPYGSLLNLHASIGA